MTNQGHLVVVGDEVDQSIDDVAQTGGRVTVRSTTGQGRCVRVPAEVIEHVAPDVAGRPGAVYEKGGHVRRSSIGFDSLPASRSALVDGCARIR